MLVFRYFVFVGGALIALLLVFDAVLPKSPVSRTNVAASDLPVIRIHSERKMPKAVVFDTNVELPKVAPVAVASDAAPAAADLSFKARVREAFAQLPEPKTVATEAKKPEVRVQPKRRFAKLRPVQRPLMVVAQQPHFGLFDTW